MPSFSRPFAHEQPVPRPQQLRQPPAAAFGDAEMQTGEPLEQPDHNKNHIGRAGHHVTSVT